MSHTLVRARSECPGVAQPRRTRMTLIRHHIAGAAHGTDARTGDVFNPATGEVQAQVAFATAAEVDEAIAAAAAALD